MEVRDRAEAEAEEGLLLKHTLKEANNINQILNPMGMQTVQEHLVQENSRNRVGSEQIRLQEQQVQVQIRRMVQLRVLGRKQEKKQRERPRNKRLGKQRKREKRSLKRNWGKQGRRKLVSEKQERKRLVDEKQERRKLVSEKQGRGWLEKKKLERRKLVSEKQERGWLEKKKLERKRRGLKTSQREVPTHSLQWGKRRTLGLEGNHLQHVRNHPHPLRNLLLPQQQRLI
jgi:hypothetical protein